MKYYKNKDYYYISYHSHDFVKYNPRYKVGTDIFILQYDGKMFFVKEVIESNNEEEYLKKEFIPTIRWCVIGWKKEDVIKQIFEKNWYDE